MALGWACYQGQSGGPIRGIVHLYVNPDRSGLSGLVSVRLCKHTREARNSEKVCTTGLNTLSSEGAELPVGHSIGKHTKGNSESPVHCRLRINIDQYLISTRINGRQIASYSTTLGQHSFRRAAPCHRIPLTVASPHTLTSTQPIVPRMTPTFFPTSRIPGARIPRRAFPTPGPAFHADVVI